MIHAFNINLASRVGVDAAVLYNSIAHHVSKQGTCNAVGHSYGNILMQGIRGHHFYIYEESFDTAIETLVNAGEIYEVSPTGLNKLSPAYNILHVSEVYLAVPNMHKYFKK